MKLISTQTNELGQALIQVLVVMALLVGTTSILMSLGEKDIKLQATRDFRAVAEDICGEVRTLLSRSNTCTLNLRNSLSTSEMSELRYLDTGDPLTGVLTKIGPTTEPFRNTRTRFKKLAIGPATPSGDSFAMDLKLTLENASSTNVFGSSEVTCTIPISVNMGRRFQTGISMLLGSSMTNDLIVALMTKQCAATNPTHPNPIEMVPFKNGAPDITVVPMGIGNSPVGLFECVFIDQIPANNEIESCQTIL